MSDYLTAEQYEYARKTGDWESGKVLTHGQALNDNQKIVLEWLKKQRIQENGLILPPIEILSNLTNYIYVSSANDKVFKSFVSLSEPEQFEVLTAFAQWGLKQEEAG
ncbi:TPA: hypothetical protein ACR8OU_001643 [Enterococcus faecium]